MSWMKEGWRRMCSFARRDAMERGLDEEIRFHIDQQTEKNLRAGMTPDEARRQASVTFGGMERVKESTRDEFRPALLQDSVRDLGYSESRTGRLRRSAYGRAVAPASRESPSPNRSRASKSPMARSKRSGCVPLSGAGSRRQTIARHRRKR
jgi:hypothetical protein